MGRTNLDLKKAIDIAVLLENAKKGAQKLQGMSKSIILTLGDGPHTVSFN